MIELAYDESKKKYIYIYTQYIYIKLALKKKEGEKAVSWKVTVSAKKKCLKAM